MLAEEDNNTYLGVGYAGENTFVQSSGTVTYVGESRAYQFSTYIDEKLSDAASYAWSKLPEDPVDIVVGNSATDIVAGKYCDYPLCGPASFVSAFYHQLSATGEVAEFSNHDAL
jgi:hypothetical protein